MGIDLEKVRLRAARGEEIVYAIVGYVDYAERLIGVCAGKPPRDGLVGDVELGIWVAPEFWGQGVGKVSIEAFCKALQAQGFRKIVAGVVEDNAGSLALFRGLGFTETGGGTCGTMTRGDLPMRSFLFQL